MYNKVYVEITNICNMNCSFCHGHKRKPRQMSQEEFEEALTEICDDYCRHPRRSELSDDDLMEICNSCPLNKLRGNADEG